MLRLRKIFPFFLLSVLFGTSLIVHSAGGEVVPSWFNKGVFVEIRLEHFPVIRYLNRSGGFGGRPSKEFCGFLRWEVLDFDGETAKMSIAVYRGPIRDLVAQAEFYVDVSTRDVTLLNGTGVGKTNLWVPANLKKDDIIPFIGKEPNVVFGKVVRGGPKRTCQGYQLSFLIETINLVIDHRVIGPYSAGSFDEDTGIRDDGILDYDGAFAAMNIEGLHGFGTWEIGNTNVDLGPRFLTSEILSFFFVDYPFTLPVIVFVSIFLVRLWRRRKKNIQQLKHYRRGL